jgi:Holliday junction resolvase-like predicted endonuclease
MDTFSIEKWTLTKNEVKHTGSRHIFHLNIPLHYIDITPQAADGNIEWEEMDKIQTNIPTHTEFQTRFDEYFAPYGDNVWNRVYIFDYTISETHDYNVNIKMQLSNGKPLPFPIPINDDARFQLLEHDNQRLNRRINRFLGEIIAIREYWQREVIHQSNLRIKMKRKWQKDKQKLINDNVRHISRMVHTIRKYYAECDEKDNCPVCFEQIESDKLYVPACCHYLCESCANHIAELNNKCPICRDVMHYDTGGENDNTNIPVIMFPDIEPINMFHDIEPLIQNPFPDIEPINMFNDMDNDIDDQGEVELVFP